MSNITILDYKAAILMRYCGEFLPADAKTAIFRKTSEDVVNDLRPMAEFTTNEVSSFLVQSGYTMDFDDDNPVWLMRKAENKFLPE